MSMIDDQDREMKNDEMLLAAADEIKRIRTYADIISDTAMGACVMARANALAEILGITKFVITDWEIEREKRIADECTPPESFNAATCDTTVYFPSGSMGKMDIYIAQNKIGEFGLNDAGKVEIYYHHNTPNYPKLKKREYDTMREATEALVYFYRVRKFAGYQCHKRQENHE